MKQHIINPIGDTFVKIQWDGKRLSITGVEGPKSNGDCSGACGQIVMHEWNLQLINDEWEPEMVKRLRDLWNRWHLNDMRAGSASQEKYLRNNPIIVTYPETHYEKACKVLADANLNPDENGYKYGTKWIFEEVPNHIIEELFTFPASKIKPAWV